MPDVIFNNDNIPDSLPSILNKQEPLVPALRPYVVAGGPMGAMIQHPLIQEIMYRKELNALINQRYRHKTEALLEAIEKKDWKTMIWIHERPWRIQTILDHQHEMTDRQYWECVGQVWTDSENIWQHYDDWRTLWESPRPKKKFAMDTTERRKLAILPDTITVYRGVNGKGVTKGKNRPGLSWTIDRDKAVWFANRWKLEPVVIKEGTVKKSDVHAYFEGRGESEIVITGVKQ